MGRQQSFAKFKDTKTLVTELKKYAERDTSEHWTFVSGVVKLIKNVYGFEKDEYAIVLSGQRYGQRSLQNLKEETGIENAARIIFIDNEYYSAMSNGDLGKFLDEHFHFLDENEYNELIA